MINSENDHTEAIDSLVNSGVCQKRLLNQVDPQNKHILLIIPFENNSRLSELPEPIGLYSYAKASSHIYLNGRLIAENGHPADSAELEKIGVMDAIYYVSKSQFISGTNYLVYDMSSFNGYLTLGNPIHLIGFAPYQNAQSYIHQLTPLGLILSGFFVLACLYFAALMLNPARRQTIGYFLALSMTAMIQLFLEMSRALIAYDYPFQDLRLLLITTCSFLFGIILLAFVSSHYAEKNKLHWLYIGGIITFASLMLSPGYDLKTTFGILTPTIIATVILFLNVIKKNERSDLSLLIAFVSFIALALNSLQSFHEIIFYIILALLLCYLFIRQAIAFNHEQSARIDDEKQLSQLAYRLEQLSQQQKPAVISIPSVGEMAMINTTEIAYCKASGDYVEIYLINKQMKLYSGTLKSLLDKLPTNFIKVHRSYLVNIECVTNIQSSQTAGVISFAEFDDIPVSRRMLASVRKVFKNPI